MATIDGSELFKDIFVLIKAVPDIWDVPCEPGISIEAYCDALLKTFPLMTWQDFIDIWTVDPNLSASTKYTWAYTALFFMGKDFSLDMQRIHGSVLEDGIIASLDAFDHDRKVKLALEACYYFWDAKKRANYIEDIQDPMIAFNLYVTFKHLTDAEDTLLETKFVGLLPTAEKELDDGVVVREKLTTITPG